MTNLVYTRPHLYPKQEAAIFTSKRWSLCEASAQPLDLEIPTPSGWRRFGDLEIGDYVFAADGSPTVIKEIVPHGIREVFQLEFTGEATTFACAEHLWAVEHESGRGERVMRTADLLAFTERTRLTWKFPVCTPVDYWIQPHTINPWLLGVLIGDGCIYSNVLSVSSADLDLVERVKASLPQGYEVKDAGNYSYTIKAKVRGAGYERPSIRHKAGAYEVHVAGKYIGRRSSYKDAIALHHDGMIQRYGDDLPELNLRVALRDLGLLGLKHNEKFVPDCYKYNDTETRREILRGLLDTNGTLQNNNAIIEQTSRRLADDIRELVMSLGGFAKTTIQPPRRAGWKTSYRTIIRHPNLPSLFWLQRKIDKHVPGWNCERRLVSIKSVGYDAVQCITVEHPSELYLTSDFIVTHNTKSGKTIGAISWIIEQALMSQRGYHHWWVAPISDQARIAFGRIKAGLTPGTFTARETPTPSITILNGAVIDCKSADNPDSLYGEDVYSGVFDEASRSRPEAWHAFRSTLTATRGPAVLIGNVKGRRNWFYEFCRRVEKGDEPNGHYARITWQDAVEAGVLDVEEIEDARRNLPEAVFRELYEAVATDDGGNPFGVQHIEACVAGLSNQPPVAFGIDLAKSQDWLVVIGLDRDGRVCHFSRWQNVPWRESIRRIHAIVGEDTPALVDSTGLGDPVLEELQAGHGNFNGLHFSAASKQRIMEGLAVSIQSREIHFPDGPIRAELETFEFERRGGRWFYSAPDGYHDDCVCALALAREQWATTAPAESIMKYYAGRMKIVQADEPDEDETAATTGFARRLTRHPSSEIVDNELTELYKATIAQYTPAENLCGHCGHPVFGTRVSDGFGVWHPACTTRPNL